MLSVPAALLVDLDGTLVETEPLWQKVQRSTVEELGGVWADSFNQQLIGVSLSDVARLIQERAGTRMPISQIQEMIISAMVASVEAGEATALPGARQLFAMAAEAEIPLAVVTSSHARLAKASLAVLAGCTPRVLVAGDMVERGKPHPEAYLLAAELLRVPIEECVVIEDSQPGVDAGLNSGAKTVAIPNHAILQTRPNLTFARSLEEISREFLAGL